MPRQPAAALCLALLCTAQIAWPCGVRAEPELTIDWAAPADRADCPDQRWLDERVAEQLGRPVRADVTAGVAAQVKIESTADGLLLTLHTRSGAASGERVVPGSDCRELSEAAVLIIALAVTEARDRELEQVSLPAPAPAAKSAAPPPKPAPAEAPHAPRARYFLRGDALLDVGFLDRPSFGPALSLGVSQGIWRAELTGLWLVPRQLESSDGPDGEVEASLWAGRLAGCALWGVSALQAGPCLALELGEATGEGSGSPTTLSARNHTLWVAGALAARVGLQVVSGVAIVLQPELLVSMRRPGFVTVDAASGARSLVHEPTPAQLRASLGVELRF